MYNSVVLSIFPQLLLSLSKMFSGFFHVKGKTFSSLYTIGTKTILYI